MGVSNIHFFLLNCTFYYGIFSYSENILKCFSFIRPTKNLTKYQTLIILSRFGAEKNKQKNLLPEKVITLQSDNWDKMSALNMVEPIIQGSL